MLKDVNYNLIHESAETSKFLARYDTYMKDSGDCKSCRQIWKTMKDHREQELEMLLDSLKECFDSGDISADEKRATA